MKVRDFMRLDIMVALFAAAVAPPADAFGGGASPKDVKEAKQPKPTAAAAATATPTATDVITLEGGRVYAGPIVIDRDGVTLTSVGGRAIVQDGIRVVNASNVTISNVTVVGSGVDNNAEDGIRVENTLPGNVKFENITIDNVEVSGFRWAGIYLSGVHDRSGFRHVRITNVDSHDNGAAGIWSGGGWSDDPTLYSHEDVYVADCTVHHNRGIAGIGWPAGHGIMLKEVNGGTVEFCEAYENGQLNTNPAGPVGIWAIYSTNIVIQYNESHHNSTSGSFDGGGFDFDGGVSYSLMQYNHSHDNRGPGYTIAQFDEYRAFTHNIIRYNVSENDGGGLAFWNHYPIYNIDIYGNRFGAQEDFRVTVDGATVGTFTPASISYAALTTAAFTVAAGSHTIAFVGVNTAGGDNTALVDDVRWAQATPAARLSGGGFESPSVGAGSFGCFAYDPAGTPWSYAGGAGVAGNGSGFTAANPDAPEGAQVAFLQATGSFSQVIAGMAAGSYQLTFRAAQRGNWGGQEDFRVTVDGATVGTFTPASTSYAALTTAAFTVAAGSHTIAFVGVNTAGGDNTALVDDVRLAQVTPAARLSGGGFESPSVGAGSFGCFAYDPAGTPWSYAGGAGVAGNGSGFTAANPDAPEGAQVAFLQATGSFSQVIAGMAAGSYQLTFRAAQRGNDDVVLYFGGGAFVNVNLWDNQ